MNLKEVYLKNSNRCPVCRSYDISTMGFEACSYTGRAWQQVRCLACDAEWDDIYSLVDIDIKQKV